MEAPKRLRKITPAKRTKASSTHELEHSSEAEPVRIKRVEQGSGFDQSADA